MNTAPGNTNEKEMTYQYNINIELTSADFTKASPEVGKTLYRGFSASFGYNALTVEREHDSSGSQTWALLLDPAGYITVSMETEK